LQERSTIEKPEGDTIAEAKREAAAFRPLYEKYFRLIFLFIYHRVDDRDATADLTAQVFLKALTRISQFNERGLPFSSWLYRIAINECNDFFRKNKRSRIVYVEEYAFNNLFEELFPENPLEELEKKLQLALQKLNPKELYLIELRFFEDLPFKTVAEVLEISENNAKVSTYRALDKIKKKFMNML
jgi:RNA polymerase sigma-70 factor, ECF subfamily